MNESRPVHAEERTEEWSDFDWERRRLRGRRMGSRAIQRAERDGRTHFVLTFREEYQPVSELADVLARRVLTWVREFHSGELIRSEEVNVELPVPARSPPPTSDDPDFF